MGKMNRWHNTTVASFLFPVTVHTSMYFLEQLLDCPAAAAQKLTLSKRSSRKTLIIIGSRDESLPFYSPLSSILFLWEIGVEKQSQCSFAGKERKNMELISSHSFSFNCVTYSSLNNPRPPSSHPLPHLFGAMQGVLPQTLTDNCPV